MKVLASPPHPKEKGIFLKEQTGDDLLMLGSTLLVIQDLLYSTMYHLLLKNNTHKRKTIKTRRVN